MSRRNAGPGPASYMLPTTVGYKDHTLNKYRAPNYSLGIRTPSIHKARSPGEKYHVEGMTRFGRSTSPAYSLKHKMKELQGLKTPGPAGYNPNIPPKGPAFSIGRLTVPFKPLDTPGPKYNIPSTIGPKVPDMAAAAAFSVGKAKRDVGEKEKSPGPAKYQAINVDSTRYKPPKYSMGHQLCPLRRQQVPGPATYTGIYRPKVTNDGFTFGHRTEQLPYITADDEMPCAD